MIAMTSTMNGNAKNRSTMRMMIVSVFPPTWPATRPIKVPTMSVTIVAAKAIARSYRPP